MNDDEFKKVMLDFKDQVLEQFASMRAELKDQDLRFNTFAQEVGSRFDQQGKRFNAVDAQLDDLREDIADVKAEVISKADAGVVYEKFDQLSGKIQSWQQSQELLVERHEEWVQRAAPQLGVRYDHPRA